MSNAATDHGSTQHRVSVEDLLKAGTHFGHLTSRWNPKMRSYIFMQRNGIHIIDLLQTQKLLSRAADTATRFARQGKPVLFVGTKNRQSKPSGKPQNPVNPPLLWNAGSVER